MAIHLMKYPPKLQLPKRITIFISRNGEMWIFFWEKVDIREENANFDLHCHKSESQELILLIASWYMRAA